MGLDMCPCSRKRSVSQNEWRYWRGVAAMLLAWWCIRSKERFDVQLGALWCATCLFALHARFFLCFPNLMQDGPRRLGDVLAAAVKVCTAQHCTAQQSRCTQHCIAL